VGGDVAVFARIRSHDQKNQAKVQYQQGLRNGLTGKESTVLTHCIYSFNTCPVNILPLKTLICATLRKGTQDDSTSVLFLSVIQTGYEFFVE
jgi:hypothetical protein